MDFKNQLLLDAEVFLGAEFAELVELDGIQLVAQFDKSTSAASSVQSRNKSGLYGDYATLYFKTNDYISARKRLPRQGEFVHLFNKRYEVLECEDELGIAHLTLKSFRQNRLRGSENDIY